MGRKLKWFRRILQASIVLAGLSGALAAHGYANTPIIDPGYNSRIIDDQIFTNYGTMTVNDIQAFLNTKVPTCDSNHPNSDGSAPSTPYICLKDYVDPTVGKRSAQIIYEAAQEFSVNPRVILVTLQKEQSLITDTWPYPSQYRSAMGYGCPESQSVCDSVYYGFYNQVHLGTKLLRVGYDRNCGNTSSYPGWTAGSQWAKGNTTPVDGRDTYLSNCSTGSFYNYTPHRPDSAYTGYPQGCNPAVAYPAAGYCTYYYGNYNFINNFNNWFGNVWAPTISWQFIAQGADRDLSSLPVGQKATLTLTARNTGTSTWTNSGSNPIRLGANAPNDRTSIFATPSWLSGGRPANMNESSVGPNQNGTFTFQIQAPNAPGSFTERFNLLAEGITWMNDPGLSYSIRIVPAVLSASVSSSTIPSSMYTDASTSVTLRLTNTGNVTWYSSGRFPIRLGTANPRDRTSPFTGTGWLGASRPTALTEASIDPGTTGTFTFSMTAPHLPNSYSEAYDLVADGLSWFNSPAVTAIQVNGVYDAQIISAPAVTVLASTTATATITLKNTGSATWVNTNDTNGAKLGTASPLDRVSTFCAGWALGCARPALMTETSVAPGANGTFTFTIQTRLGQSGTYNESLRLLNDSWGWYGPVITLPINVTAATYSYALAGQAAYTSSAKTTGIDLGNLSPGQTGWLTATLRNTGNETWYNNGANPIHLGTVSARDRSSRYATAGWLNAARPAAMVEASVAPGATGTFEFPIAVPAAGGVFNESFGLVAEGYAWMNGSLAFYTNVNADYRWAYVTQYGYTDASKTTGVNMMALAPNQRVYVGILIKNVGGSTWYNSGPFPMDMGTSRAYDRQSPFCDVTWLGCNRPARMMQSSVAPGQTAEFGFYYKAPGIHAYFHDYFSPVVEGITWLGDQGLNFYSATP